jgi:hypothetical protein
MPMARKDVNHLLGGVLGLMAAVLAGCNGLRGPAFGGPPPGGNTGPAAAPFEPGADARFTILLRLHTNPATHIQESEVFRENLVKRVGWRDVFVIHKAGFSELCWGAYETIEAARPNLKTAQEYVAPNRDKVFALARVFPLPTKDVGPPEWSLLNNAKGEYTVLVAIFYDVPEAKYFARKENSLTYCKQLRDEGHEAYYLHGPAQSMVYVGSFPPEAVQKVEINDIARPVVKDKKMLEVMKTFPFLAVNGRSQPTRVINPITGKVSTENVGTYPIPIPQEKSLVSGGAVSRPGNP